ncbi:hypothetical protein LTS18_009217 [Coniosporium uncinatum]|uniref:Uncharacterized protein n=1 Tax=Coniosporium uncinatum TaxID=93489 RepID=A0ACC3DMJ5_9PEZI|nr:hypothetical protein LTS18_009217 [Coniosporium uncinatum]
MADKMGDNDLERVDSYQYPAAHIGHLNDVQQKRLEEFKELAAKKGYYAPAGQNGANVASHDDATMLRYLRARKFTPTEAFGQFKDTEDWRKSNQMEELYDTIDVEITHNGRVAAIVEEYPSTSTK